MGSLWTRFRSQFCFVSSVPSPVSDPMILSTPATAPLLFIPTPTPPRPSSRPIPLPLPRRSRIPL